MAVRAHDQVTLSRVNDGVGISSTVIAYQASSSGTVAPTGSWVANPPATSVGQYLWSRTLITYTSGSTSTSYSVARHGATGGKGATGDTGVSVSSVTPYYWLGNTKPAVPTVLTPPSPWSTVEPTYTPGYTYDLYVTIRTVLSNNSYQYSPVSLSASFAAAKAAYNTATEAQVDALSALTKARESFTDASLIAAAATGRNLYPDSNFEDGLNGIQYYTYSGTSVITLVSGVADAPNNTKNVVRVAVTPANNTAPTSGAFVHPINTGVVGSYLGRVFILKFVAKIPEGVRLQTASNSLGNGGFSRILGNDLGTGLWETYHAVYSYGDTGSPGSSGHIRIYNDGLGSPVTFDIAFSSVYEVAGAAVDPNKGILLGEQAIIGIDQAREDLALAYSTEISESMGEIMLTVSTEYATKDEMVDEVGAVISQIEQNAQNVDIRFIELSDATVEVEDELTRYKSEVANYIRFSAQGIELGKTGSPFVARLSNSELAFMESGKKVAYVSNNQLHITNAEVKNNLAMGTETTGFFDFIPRANGNLSFKFRPGSGS